MSRVILDTEDYKKMRYETAGDWYKRRRQLRIIAARLGDWKMEACLQIHELVEAWLCRAHGVTEAQVDEFDFAFKGDGEPGDAPDCPYGAEHRAADVVERTLAFFLEVDWNEYERRIGEL